MAFSDGKVIDYHVNGMASSLLLEFLNGSSFEDYYSRNIKSKYESAEVNEKDEFSWKSDSDGSGSINYVNKSDAKKEQANSGLSRRRGYGGMSYIYHTIPAYRPSPPPRPVTPPAPSFEKHNRDVFRKLFGGA